MESLAQPFDLILLTHGLPNYLSSGTGYFASYKDIDKLAGKLPHLDAVFLQSCFGESLAEDFKAAGAKNVLSYPGLNQNFFFYGLLLRNLNPQSSMERAYQQTVLNFRSQMATPLYHDLAMVITSQIDQARRNSGLAPLTVDEYVSALPAPVFKWVGATS